MQEVKRIDFVGLFLLTAGIVLFILGISWGGQPVPWKSAQILCLLIIGFVLCVLFVLWGKVFPRFDIHFVRLTISLNRDLLQRAESSHAYVFLQRYQRIYLLGNYRCDFRSWICCAFRHLAYAYVYVHLHCFNREVDLHLTEVANIYAAGSNPVGWEEQAWLTSAVTFAIVGGIVFWGAVLPIIKHVKKQMILMALMVLAFSGGLIASSRDNKGRNAAFAFLSMFADGMLEITPLSLVQISANDADLGTVFGKYLFANMPSKNFVLA